MNATSSKLISLSSFVRKFNIILCGCLGHANEWLFPKVDTCMVGQMMSLSYNLSRVSITNRLEIRYFYLFQLFLSIVFSVQCSKNRVKDDLNIKFCHWLSPFHGNVIFVSSVSCFIGGLHTESMRESRFHTEIQNYPEKERNSFLFL